MKFNILTFGVRKNKIDLADTFYEMLWYLLSNTIRLVLSNYLIMGATFDIHSDVFMMVGNLSMDVIINLYNKYELNKNKNIENDGR